MRPSLGNEEVGVGEAVEFLSLGKKSVGEKNQNPQLNGPAVKWGLDEMPGMKGKTQKQKNGTQRRS